MPRRAAGKRKIRQSESLAHQTSPPEPGAVRIGAALIRGGLATTDVCWMNTLPDLPELKTIGKIPIERRADRWTIVMT